MSWNMFLCIGRLSFTEQWLPWHLLFLCIDLYIKIVCHEIYWFLYTSECNEISCVMKYMDVLYKSEFNGISKSYVRYAPNLKTKVHTKKRHVFWNAVNTNVGRICLMKQIQYFNNHATCIFYRFLRWKLQSAWTSCQKMLICTWVLQKAKQQHVKTTSTQSCKAL